MSIFSRIKDAIFGHKSATPPPATTQTTTAEGNVGGAGSAPTTALEEPRTVDVGEVLANIAAAKGNPDLNYQSSIVDLLKLLDIDSSLENREELATELGYTGPKDGSAEMNIWLHKAVMRELAANGGQVPASMLD
ncbi:MAG TPA: DUF3597 domain-containing protein [Sphingomicrobium sp.]|jgi:hypothetical protein|nr:DUF3597 domain-containing protein [Sphingomicrobium sp.]